MPLVNKIMAVTQEFVAFHSGYYAAIFFGIITVQKINQKSKQLINAIVDTSNNSNWWSRYVNIKFV